MERPIAFVAAIFIGVATLLAQEQKSTPGTVDTECLLITSEQDWTAIGLNAQQVQEVRAVQTDCKTDCLVNKESAPQDPQLGQAILGKHKERVRRIVGEELYAKWLKWCSEREGKT